MQLGTHTLPVGAILAPMAGVTDHAFRAVCASLGAAATVTEMVSAKALCYQDRKSASLLRRNEGVICGAQIFGSEPEIMARGAALALEHSHCDFIDLNMGCPMPKIVNNGEGSAVPVPVTVKTRKGWDKSHITVVELAKAAEDNGAAAIAVHGRTKTMLYSGTADWDIIAEVKQAVKIPVIANGDVLSAESALRCRNRTGADAVMVGRASFGDPWLFAEIRAALAGEPIPARPPLRVRMETAARQMELACGDKGEHIACLEARKHLAWYLRGVAYSNYYKQQISAIQTMDDVRRVIAGIQRDLS